MLKKIGFWLMFGLISTPTTTQALETSPINIGHIHTISSKALNETREIQVYLPSSYEEYPNQRYPVLYLLDGESNFHYLTGFIQKLSKAPYPHIPEMIVVGIINTDRVRDLTPTVQNNSSDNKNNRNIQGATGGNPNFFLFLETEVMPYIEQNYRTTGFNTLIGHSFGGITALNHLLNGTKEIQAYIVHDPSIWWDDEVILKRFQSTKKEDFQHKKLFISQVDEKENKGDLSTHYNGIKKLNAYLEERAFHNLNYQYVQYPSEDHGTIPLKGNLDGLRYIFDGININIKEIPQNPHLIQEHYAKLSEHLHFTFQPSEPYLATVLNYLKRSADEEIQADFLNYILTIYPDSKLAK